MYLSFTLAAAVPLGSESDPGCIFFTLNTCQATFISDILWNVCRKSKKIESVTYGRMYGRTDRREVWNSYLDGLKQYVFSNNLYQKIHNHMLHIWISSFFHVPFFQYFWLTLLLREDMRLNSTIAVTNHHGSNLDWIHH